jgi:hypothetical protein
MTKIKLLTITVLLLVITNCGFNSKEFNTNISKNRFIGIEESGQLKKLDKDTVEGLCNGLTESQALITNHNLILNKNMVCIVAKKNKETKNEDN